MKSFEEIYEIIKNEDYSDLEELRLKEKKKKGIIITLIVSILLIPPILMFTEIINSYFLEQILPKIMTIFELIVVVGIISFLFYFLFLLTRIGSSKKPGKKKYKYLFKERIISKLISTYDSNLKFDNYLFIQKELYNKAQFEIYDHYSANDLVFGKIDGIIDFKMGDVHTEIESIDSDGNSSYITLFRGLFSSAKLDKNLNATIKIRKNRGQSGKGLSGKAKLHMDSAEFEKNFDIYSSDQILAMRILTSDIMDYMVNFTTENKVKFEITILNQDLFIRIHCKNMFEASLSKSSIDENILKEYYTYLNFMCELNKKFYRIISEKDI